MSKGFRAATEVAGQPRVLLRFQGVAPRRCFRQAEPLCRAQEVQGEASKLRATGLIFSLSCKAGGLLGGQLLEWAGQQLHCMHTSLSY